MVAIDLKNVPSNGHPFRLWFAISMFTSSHTKHTSEDLKLHEYSSLYQRVPLY